MPRFGIWGFMTQSWICRDSKLSWEHSFYMQVNQCKPTPPPAAFSGSHTAGQTLFLCPDHSRARRQTTRSSPYTLKPWKDQTSQSWICIPHLTSSFPWRHTMNFPTDPLTLPLPNWPGGFPMWSHVACPSLLGTVNNKLSSQWQLSPYLLASPMECHQTWRVTPPGLVHNSLLPDSPPSSTIQSIPSS